LGVSELDNKELEDAVVATEGRTATYLREVVRRAALRSADEHPHGVLLVDGQMLARAASDLLDDRTALTRSLLGGPEDPDAEPPLEGFPDVMTFGPRMTGGAMFGWHSGREGHPIPFAPED
jgi:hypothetical protein